MIGVESLQMGIETHLDSVTLLKMDQQQVFRIRNTRREHKIDLGVHVGKLLA